MRNVQWDAYQQQVKDGWVSHRQALLALEEVLRNQVEVIQRDGLTEAVQGDLVVILDHVANTCGMHALSHAADEGTSISPEDVEKYSLIVEEKL